MDFLKLSGYIKIYMSNLTTVGIYVIKKIKISCFKIYNISVNLKMLATVTLSWKIHALGHLASFDRSTVSQNTRPTQLCSYFTTMK